MNKRSKIIHFMHHPVSAKRFVEPLVISLIELGYDAELCVTNYSGLDGFISSYKVPYSFFDFNIVLNVRKLTKSFFKLFFYVRKQYPVLIQAHQTRAAFIPLLVSYLNRVPVRIYHNHGVPYIGYKGLKRYVLRCLEALNCYFATHIITVSHGMIKPIRSVAPYPKSLDLIGPGSACGLSHDDFNFMDFKSKSLAKEKFGLKSDSLVFLYVGRPEKRKGFNILLKAFIEKFAGNGNVHLLLAGCTEDDLRSTEKSCHLNIHPLGILLDLNPLYDIADVVVLPSFHEGFGYALLEGAAHGCALLASDIPGPDDLVFDKVNGVLVRPNVISDLIDKLNYLYSNRIDLINMGKNSYEISLRYEREIVLSYYNKYINNILNEFI